MKYYAAPMEGITGYIYRNAHHNFYPGMDKYYTPFLTPKEKRGMTRREKNDILPEHNQGIKVVPQVLTNRSHDFLTIMEDLADMGYEEVNLNLGCPSGTVVSKGKGCGFLAKREELRRFMEDVFEGMARRKLDHVDFSVKSRLGVDEPEEIIPLMGIYNDYPISELILHARIHKDFYKKPVNMEYFSEAFSLSKHPICYNGDIFYGTDLLRLTQRFPKVEAIMLGRGLIANPQLREDCQKSLEMQDMQESLATKEGLAMKEGLVMQDTLAMREEEQESGSQGLDFDYERFFYFHDQVLEGYIAVMSGDRNVLFKMKELWQYMAIHFPGQEKKIKKIKKSNTLLEYKSVVKTLSFS